MNKEVSIVTARAKKSVAKAKRNTISSNKNGASSMSGEQKSITPRKLNQISGVQYVLPLGNGWVVKGAERAVFTTITDSKTEAITIARTIARDNHLELIVHGKDGSIEIREDYSATV